MCGEHTEWFSFVTSQCLSRAATDPAPFLQLLQELCTVFNVDLPCRVKSSQLGIISNKQTHTSAIVKPQSSSCSYICQHCLVHLGDIGELQKKGWDLEFCLCSASREGSACIMATAGATVLHFNS